MVWEWRIWEKIKKIASEKTFQQEIHMGKKGAILKKRATKRKIKQKLKMHPVNRKHKDGLFRLAFLEKKYQLELYNALSGTSYSDPEKLEVTTLEDVLFLGMKNDLSFIIGMSMNLYEHQSSKNLNMPLRGLIYFAQIYQEYVVKHGYSLYAESRIPLPFPNYIVFYNGGKEMPDEEELLLSDAFPEDMKNQLPALECRARLININQSHNKALMQRCQRLREYTEFIAMIREYLSQGMDMQEAAHMAWHQGMKKGILTDLLSRSGTEVVAMLLEEYDAEEVLKYRVREAAEKAAEKATKEATDKTLIRTGKLNKILLSQKKYDELEKASEDIVYLRKLLKEYEI